MKKKIRESKLIHGTAVFTLAGRNGRIVCITDEGERFTVPFKLLFTLLDNFDFTVEKFGQFLRATSFEDKIEGGGFKFG